MPLRATCHHCQRDFQRADYHRLKRYFCSHRCYVECRQRASKLPLNRLWRFWRFVPLVSADQCWEWMGNRMPAGYGQGGGTYAHIVSYQFHRGPIPKGLFVLHRCDNPPCVNPAHLFLGTPLDNIRDASAKGRMHPGERNGAARLSEAQAREIYARASAGEKHTALSREFKISRSIVTNIANRKLWVHIHRRVAA